MREVDIEIVQELAKEPYSGALQKRSFEQCHRVHHAGAHPRRVSAGDSGRAGSEIGGTEGTAKESPLGGHVIDYFHLADRSADGLQREFKDETKLRVGIWHARVSVRQPNTVHQQTHHSHRDEGDHKIPSGKRRNCLCRPGS